MFVGRTGARARLADAIDRALAGESGLVLLTGERGIGTTSLLRHVLADRTDLRVGWGVGGALGAVTPRGRGPRDPGVVARHLVEGGDDGDRGTAVELLRDAASAATSALADEDALHHLRRARRLVAADDHRAVATLLLDEVDAHLALGEVHAAIADGARVGTG